MIRFDFHSHTKTPPTGSDEEGDGGAKAQSALQPHSLLPPPKHTLSRTPPPLPKNADEEGDGKAKAKGKSASGKKRSSTVGAAADKKKPPKTLARRVYNALFWWLDTVIKVGCTVQNTQVNMHNTRTHILCSTYMHKFTHKPGPR